MKDLMPYFESCCVFKPLLKKNCNKEIVEMKGVDMTKPPHQKQCLTTWQVISKRDVEPKVLVKYIF